MQKEYMGLLSFKGDHPTLKETLITKNDLNKKELKSMDQLVSEYLDFVERQAEREQVMTIEDWSKHLDNILTMSGEKLIEGNGSISHKQVVAKATDKYKKYQAKTLSSIEKDYLESLKFLEDKVK